MGDNMTYFQTLYRLALAALAATTIATTAGAVTTTLTMDTDPVDEGWRLWKYAGSHSVSNGILKVTAPGYYEFKAPDSVWRNAVSNERGWAIETRMRRNAASIGTPSMWIYDGKHYVAPMFTNDGLSFRSGSAFRTGFSLDTSVFHTYRFEGKGDRLDVLIDGTRVRSLQNPSYSWAAFVFMFGDDNYSPGGISYSEWDYVSVTTGIEIAPIPLPPALLLMGAALAGLAVAARPRKGRQTL